MRIAVLGTGLMGFPMARRLCEAGHAVQAWNRTAAKAQPLQAYGASVHTTAAAAVQGCELVLTMLEDGDAVAGVLLGPAGVAAHMPAGSLLVDMSSIRPAQARAHAHALQARAPR